MATVKKGMLTTTGKWWKHLRSTKRLFWKGERQAARKFVRLQAFDDTRFQRAGKPLD